MLYKCGVMDHDNNAEYKQVWSTAFPHLVNGSQKCQCVFDRHETHGELVKTGFVLAAESVVVSCAVVGLDLSVLLPCSVPASVMLAVAPPARPLW